MAKLMKWLMLVLIPVSCLCLSSCGGDDDADELINPSDIYEQKTELFQKLKGTSWELISYKVYTHGSYDFDQVHRYPDLRGKIFTFSTALYPDVSYKGENITNAYTLYCNGSYKNQNIWAIRTGQLWVEWIGQAPNIIFGLYDVEFSNNRLLLYDYLNGELQQCITLDRTYTSAEPDDDQNEEDPSYEKPEIGLEDFTCYTTSITLKYRIYNQDKAKVTSATGYYGTSSPSKSITASVSGSLITIRATGLKKGTTYCFKCKATGKGGSTTSETTKLSTLY